MINGFKCIITSCALIDQDHGVWAWGDLFTDGHTYTFNAVMGEDGEITWAYGPPPERNALIIDRGYTYFERRGVVVISKANAQLNDLAKEYTK